MINAALKTMIFVPVAAVALTAAFVGAATGAAANERPVMKVSHVDLDLTTTKGVQAFDKRIRSAARSACTSAYQNVAINMRDEQLCIDDLVSVAAAQRNVAIAQAGGLQRELASR